LLLVQNVSKLYRLYRKPFDRIRELNPLRKTLLHTDFWALRDISFSVERGEVVSLVGPNGCGKSTLLQVISGILQPTTGRVVTRGRVAALLELGAGFNPEFSGRENVFINGEIMGISRAEMDRNLPSIEAFAEIGEFIHRPVKEYSSGMYARLADYRFGHNLLYPLQPALLCSYHPSQQNTSTGKLTQEMLDAVFLRAARLIETGAKRSIPVPAAPPRSSPPRSASRKR